MEVHKTVYVDSEFTEEEFMIIQEAADEWAQETNNLATFDVYYGIEDGLYNKIKHDPNSLLVVKSNSETPLVKSLDKLIKGEVLGFFLKELEVQSILLVNDRMLGDHYYKAVVIHEMGHSIGLPHTRDEESIMYRSMNYVYYLTKSDIRWFCRAYYCDAEKLGGLM